MSRMSYALVSSALFIACTPPPQKGGQGAHDESSADAKAPVDTDESTPSESSPSDGEITVPGWYSKDIIEHTEVMQDGRSQLREDGTYSAALLMRLVDGIGVEDCEKSLRKVVSKEVPNLSAPKPGKNGRLEVRGETDEYFATYVCGAGKDDKMTAYLSYATKK